MWLLFVSRSPPWEHACVVKHSQVRIRCALVPVPPPVLFSLGAWSGPHITCCSRQERSCSRARLAGAGVPNGLFLQHTQKLRKMRLNSQRLVKEFLCWVCCDGAVCFLQRSIHRLQTVGKKCLCLFAGEKKGCVGKEELLSVRWVSALHLPPPKCEEERPPGKVGGEGPGSGAPTPSCGVSVLARCE